jgi:hypothetical protein
MNTFSYAVEHNIYLLLSSNSDSKLVSAASDREASERIIKIYPNLIGLIKR